MDEFEFGQLDLDTTDLTKDEIISLNKKMAKIIKQARENAKINKCYYCGTENIQFCNSHSIPQFALRNIAIKGELLYTNKLMKLPFEKEEKGINEAGTFKIICRDCDSQIFSDYENPEKYYGEITPKMLAEISLKNYLKIISKRLVEIEMYNQAYTLTQNPINIGIINQKQKINNIDLNEYKKSYEKAKRVSKKNWDNEYYLIYAKKLDYVVPIAFQSNLALVCDLENNIINDIYIEDEKYKIQDIQLAIFPLKDCSIILLFMDSNNTRYRKFNKQFNKLSEDEKLEVLNYIMFLYSEDIFISPSMEKVMLDSKELIQLSKSTADMIAFKDNIFKENVNYLEAVKEQFSLINRKRIPNFLSREYAI